MPAKTKIRMRSCSAPEAFEYKYSFARSTAGRERKSLTAPDRDAADQPAADKSKEQDSDNRTDRIK
jgi:hypothetical protein